QIQNPAQWATDPYSITFYDGINIMALAMLEAKTPDPKFYNSYIPKVTAPSSGAKVVHTFAEGKAALAAGQKIQYIGAGGVVIFDKWHNSPGGFEVAGLRPDGSTALTTFLSVQQLSRL